MKKVIGIIVFGFLLNGCASTPEDYMNISPRNLCIAWYERIGGNIHAAPMGKAIDMRGIDCNPYMDSMKAAKKSRDEYYQGLKDNLDHLGSSSTGQTVCTTQRIGTSGVAKTTCREK